MRELTFAELDLVVGGNDSGSAGSTVQTTVAAVAGACSKTVSSPLAGAGCAVLGVAVALMPPVDLVELARREQERRPGAGG